LLVSVNGEPPYFRIRLRLINGRFDFLLESELSSERSLSGTLQALEASIGYELRATLE
jgi:hypothetical protein